MPLRLPIRGFLVVTLLAGMAGLSSSAGRSPGVSDIGQWERPSLELSKTPLPVRSPEADRAVEEHLHDLWFLADPV